MINILHEFVNNLELNSFIDLFKFLIPVLLTIYGIVYIRRSNFYYIERQNIKLYDDIVKKIKGISIKYNLNEINENLILFNGTIILKSHNDIKKDDVDQELKIISPDINAQWKHFEITNSSVDFIPKFTIDGNSIIFEKSLLKADDFISFAGLLDSKNNTLKIGHRIFNIIPRSINFKEGDLKFYKAVSILFLFLILFLASFFKYNSDQRKSNLYEGNYNRKISAKDSILYKTYDFKPIYNLNGKKFNIDSINSNYKKIRTEELIIIEKLNKKELDSLMQNYKQNRTDKNYIKVLEKIMSNTKESFSQFQNPYPEIEKEANKQLQSLISKNKLKNNFSYTLNDSIKVKYIENTAFQSFNNNDKTNYIEIIFSIIGYILGLCTTIIAVIFSYKYYRLRKLKKIYD